MQTSNQKWAIGIVIVVGVLVLVGLVTRPTASVPSNIPGASMATSSTASSTGNPQVSQEVIPTLTVPDFRKSVKFSSTVSGEIRSAIEKGVTTVKERLTKDSLDLKSWIDLGTLKKMAGDYAGAEEAWVFVTVASPNNSIAYNNLGDLYTNFLKNYPKAETSYLTAIRVDPSDASAYRDLASLYDNFYKKGTSAGEETLKKGVAAVPDSVDLHVLLARYYKSAGKAADAKKQYEAAIAAANKAGQTEAAAQIKTEAGQ